MKFSLFDKTSKDFSKFFEFGVLLPSVYVNYTKLGFFEERIRVHGLTLNTKLIIESEESSIYLKLQVLGFGFFIFYENFNSNL